MRSIFAKARALFAAVTKPGASRPGSESEPAAAGEFDPELLAVLACPSTHEPLRYDPEAGLLIADRAGLAYPVVDGIPILLAGAARPPAGTKAAAPGS